MEAHRAILQGRDEQDISEGALHTAGRASAGHTHRRLRERDRLPGATLLLQVPPFLLFSSLL